MGLPSATRLPVQFDDAGARGDRRRQCRAACVRAVFRSEDGKRTVADQLEHIAAMLMNGRDDCIGVVIQQWDYLFRCSVGDAREPSQITEPNNGIDALGNSAHDTSAEHALTGVATEIGFHQRSGHARERYRFDGEREIGRDALEARRCGRR